jgi:hypothetical protein
MKKTLLLFLFLSLTLMGIAQENGFPFGGASRTELQMNKCEFDSTAAAMVLDEFGEAYFDEGKLLFEYHAKIKILTKEGVKHGDFRIPLRKNESNKEEIVKIKAVTHNLVAGKIEWSEMDRKTVFFETNSRYADFAKFALPNVKVGSVIEVAYTIKTPFILNFWPWEFQSEIPKVRSEFWAKIQGNYQYNIALRGFLKLSKNESNLVYSCFNFGIDKADCVLYKYAMDNIPAFKEEEYMTAKSNFIAAINFELKEIQYFDGRVDKVTREWKDVEDELMENSDFGSQLKKAKSLAQDVISGVINPDSSDLHKVKKIYSWVRDHYSWNEQVRLYSEFGVKKAWESKVGNSADINFILWGFLESAGLTPHPVILSTRSNGNPVADLYPVLSDYNYVVISVEVMGVVYLLDATEKFMPFGLLPIRCLNGKGRMLAKKKSDFVDLSATKGKQRRFTNISLKLDEVGNFKGTVFLSYSEYDAAARREEISVLSKKEELLQFVQKEWPSVEMKSYSNENLLDVEKPLIEKLEIEFNAELEKPKLIYLNPFLTDRWNENPFKSNERTFPVDFGTPFQKVMSLAIELPSGYKLDELPKSIALGLPSDGGRFTLASNKTDKLFTLRSTLMLNKAVYNSEEYHYLKELFSRIIQMEQADLVFVSSEQK